jgi:hypothetical protein
MPMIRFRLFGNRANTDTVIAVLHGIDEVEHIEEVDYLMPQMREDSSSSESGSDSEGRLYRIEVDCPTDEVADVVRESAQAASHQTQTSIEFVSEF